MLSDTMVVLCETGFVLIVSLIATVTVAVVGTIVVCTPKLVFVGIMLVLCAVEPVVVSVPLPTSDGVTGLIGAVLVLDSSTLLLVVSKDPRELITGIVVSSLETGSLILVAAA